MTSPVAGPTGFTDIRRDGWIARLPRAAQPFALLARLDRPIGVWLLFLPGLWGILLADRGFWVTLRLIVLFGVGAIIMRGAGCVVNDLWDRKLDRAVARTAGRPLAAGMVSVPGAIGFLLLLLALGLVILLQLNRTAQLTGAASLILVALYPAAKRVTWFPQIVLGLTFGWGALLGTIAASGHLSWAGLSLYGAAICWILGYDTIYAHQDREDDALVGIKSTARWYGAQTRPFLARCYAGTLGFLLLALALSDIDMAGWAAMIIPASLLAWQVIALDIDDPAGCLALFKLNRAVGLAVALAIMVGH